MLSVAGIGLIWPVFRTGYTLGYYRASEKRLRWIFASMPPVYIFVLGSLTVAVLRIMRGLI